MFFAIQANAYEKNTGILDQMFRLRKQVFFDQLCWQVEVQGDYERDRYDDLGPVYLVWADIEREVLYAAIRLMPTTGPTLLYDVFYDTLPDAAHLSAPGIWEATRACVHHENLERDFPGVSPMRAFGLMSLASAECAFAHAISTIVVNYEPYLKRAYASAGALVEEIGRAGGYGRYPVCCGLFEISESVILRMRAKLGLEGSIIGTENASPLQLTA
ncbi:acyl-homoserine-lactone synthase [Nitratireductor soli]|uniref:acyl-homoserine-lactone synthase n=1 Tax=Nitratireductor soli TaxID=1670619 RepID=UPI00065E7AC6|nr:acyl-homoserine-lactone synthase [Nitratireductor soli]